MTVFDFIVKGRSIDEFFLGKYKASSFLLVLTPSLIP